MTKILTANFRETKQADGRSTKEKIQKAWYDTVLCDILQGKFGFLSRKIIFPTCYDNSVMFIS